jgi:hypothetical protein
LTILVFSIFWKKKLILAQIHQIPPQKFPNPSKSLKYANTSNQTRIA